jgi:hypothetical protein
VPEPPEYRRRILRSLVVVALLALIASPAAFAQTLGPPQPTAPASADPGGNSIGEAPIGHRQPRAQDLPADTYKPEDPAKAAAAEKALNRSMKGICRGC